MAEILRFETLPSTNTYLKELARGGVEAGTAVLARSQSGGRGRLGRSFVSPEGGIYLSLLLKPELKAEQAARLGCAAAIAVCRAVEACCGLSPEIKWPNDLLLRGRKLCGILAESTRDREDRLCIILGLGLNVNTAEFPAELRDIATSLYLESGREQDIEALSLALISSLREICSRWGEDGRSYLEEYRRRCTTVGKKISPGDKLFAQALGINPDYSLSLRYEDGREEDKSFGEIFHIS